MEGQEVDRCHWGLRSAPPTWFICTCTASSSMSWTVGRLWGWRASQTGDSPWSGAVGRLGRVAVTDRDPEWKRPPGGTPGTCSVTLNTTRWAVVVVGRGLQTVGDTSSPKAERHLMLWWCASGPELCLWDSVLHPCPCQPLPPIKTHIFWAGDGTLQPAAALKTQTMYQR